MSVTIVVILLGALLLVIVGLNMLQQHKAKLEAARRQELIKQKNVLSEIEHLQSAGSLLPFSNTLVRVLNQRLLESINQFLTIDPTNADMVKRKKDLTTLLSNLASSPPTERTIESFKCPTESKKAVSLIKALKRLKDLLKQEQSKGILGHDEFIKEAQRIDQLLLRINATMLMDRAQTAFSNRQNGSARQYLAQLAKLLSASNSDEAYVQGLQQKAMEIIEKLNERQQASLQDHVEEAVIKETDELDELFSPKKKW